MDDEGPKTPLPNTNFVESTENGGWVVRRGQRITPKSEDLLIRTHQDLRSETWAPIAPTMGVRAVAWPRVVSAFSQKSTAVGQPHAKKETKPCRQRQRSELTISAIH